MNNLGVWYARSDVDEVRAELNLRDEDARQRKAFDAGIAKAHTRDSMQAVAKP